MSQKETQIFVLQKKYKYEKLKLKKKIREYRKLTNEDTKEIKIISYVRTSEINYYIDGKF